MGSFLFLIQCNCEKQRVCYESGSDPRAAFGLLSGHTCSFLGNYLSDVHRFPVKRRAAAFGGTGWSGPLVRLSRGWIGSWWGAGWGRPGRLWPAGPCRTRMEMRTKQRSEVETTQDLRRWTLVLVGGWPPTTVASLLKDVPIWHWFGADSALHQLACWHRWVRSRAAINIICFNLYLTGNSRGGGNSWHARTARRPGEQMWTLHLRADRTAFRTLIAL